MKIFDSLDLGHPFNFRRVNFVDNNNVLVGFDIDQHSAEEFGYYLFDHLPNHDIEYDNDKIKWGGTAEWFINNCGVDELDKYNFDRFFFKLHQSFGLYKFPDSGAVTSRLTHGDNGKEIYLGIWNYHNGFYSHGFEMRLGNEIIRSEDL